MNIEEKLKMFASLLHYIYFWRRIKEIFNAFRSLYRIFFFFFLKNKTCFALDKQYCSASSQIDMHIITTLFFYRKFETT